MIQTLGYLLLGAGIGISLLFGALASLAYRIKIDLWG